MPSPGARKDAARGDEASDGRALGPQELALIENPNLEHRPASDRREDELDVSVRVALTTFPRPIGVREGPARDRHKIAEVLGFPARRVGLDRLHARIGGGSRSAL
jgi:hypothetical protein